MKHNRTVALLVLAALLAGLLSACNFKQWLYDELPDGAIPGLTSPSPSPLPSPPSGPAKNDLMSLPWKEQTPLDPLRDDGRLNQSLFPLLYEGLFVLDETFEPTPVLCSSHTTADHLSWLFTVRSGVVFHDGTALDAHIVAANLQKALLPGSLYAGRLADVASVRAVDDATVEIVLRTPNPRLPALLTVPMTSPAGSDYGTGPYAVIRAENGAYLQAFDGWWRKKPLPVIRWELSAVTTSDELLYGFETGAVTVLTYDRADESSVRPQAGFESFGYPTPIFQYIGFNTTRPLWTLPAARRMVSAAVNRAALCTELFDAQADPALLPLPPVSPLYPEANRAETGYSLADAAALLSSLGYVDHDGDGFVDVKNRAVFEPLTLDFIVNVENPQRAAAAEQVAEALRSIGLTVNVRALSWSNFEKALRDGEFDLYYGEATLAADFSPSLFVKGGSLGYGGYENPEIDAALAAARADMTYNQKTSWLDFWELWQAECPIAPVLFRRQQMLTQRGRIADPRPVWGHVFYHLPEWEVR